MLTLSPQDSLEMAAEISKARNLLKRLDTYETLAIACDTTAAENQRCLDVASLEKLRRINIESYMSVIGVSPNRRHQLRELLRELISRSRGSVKDIISNVLKAERRS